MFSEIRFCMVLATDISQFRRLISYTFLFTTLQTKPHIKPGSFLPVTKQSDGCDWNNIKHVVVYTLSGYQTMW